ncbi:hypothetical protein [Salinactinospora qingdaonensis]|uniref:CHRD domain-containing protein n=1 Tax=Salinactinospora qingdaonensis TaxID=702744 RepID=A0ABP7GHK7_9ACTN
MATRKLAAVALTVPVCVVTAAAPAMAEQHTETLHANLQPLNESGASGTANVTVEGTHVTVDINSNGLVADAPHAQHFHIGGQNTCPTDEADTNDNGLISTPEGQPFYGDIQTSLTTEGDTSPDSGLAVDRMPTADSGGNVDYSRSFEVPQDVADSLRDGDAVIVQHGIDVNGNGEYDTEAGQSELDPALPAEATHPATCGRLTSAPDGGVAAGGGGAMDNGANTALAGFGAFLVAAAGTVLFLGRRAHANR